MNEHNARIQLGRTLVEHNKDRQILRRQLQLSAAGYSPDAARQIAWVSRYLTAFTFNGEFFSFGGKK